MAGALAFALVPAAAEAAFPGGNGRIAYVISDYPEEFGMFTISPDGSGKHRLSAFGAQPAWSADGQRIAFVYGDVVSTIRQDGSGFTQLADAQYSLASPSFSPDGERIVLAGTPPGFTRGGIVTIRTDGTEPELLVPGASTDPVYSPNGKRIAFEGEFPGREGKGIWTIRRDGSHRRKLTRQPSDNNPDYSPDGRRIAFARGSVFKCKTIRIMRADGSREHGIPHTCSAGSPAFAPSGNRIVFASGGVSTFGECSNLYTISPRGKHKRRITDNLCNGIPPADPGSAGSPSWQPLPE